MKKNWGKSEPDIPIRKNSADRKECKRRYQMTVVSYRRREKCEVNSKESSF